MDKIRLVLPDEATLRAGLLKVSPAFEMVIHIFLEKAGKEVSAEDIQLMIRTAVAETPKEHRSVLEERMGLILSVLMPHQEDVAKEILRNYWRTQRMRMPGNEETLRALHSCVEHLNIYEPFCKKVAEQMNSQLLSPQEIVTIFSEAMDYLIGQNPSLYESRELVPDFMRAIIGNDAFFQSTHLFLQEQAEQAANS